MSDALKAALEAMKPEPVKDEAKAIAQALGMVVPVAEDPDGMVAKLRGSVEKAEPAPMKWDGAEPPTASPSPRKRVSSVQIRPCPTRGCSGQVHMSESVTAWRCPVCRTAFPALPRGG